MVASIDEGAICNELRLCWSYNLARRPAIKLELIKYICVGDDATIQ